MFVYSSVECSRNIVSGNEETRKDDTDVHVILFIILRNWGFPGGAVVESPPANAGDTGSSPGLGGSRMPRSN